VGAISPGASVFIGASQDNATVAGYFAGKLYDVRVYSVCLSSTQVTALFNTDNSGTEGNCTGKWLFADGTGSTVTDSSGNSHNGTFHGTVPYWGAR
jgi:hypothetical protein